MNTNDRRSLFSSGNIARIKERNITRFTAADILAALENYHIDCLEHMRALHPTMIADAAIGNEVYRYILTPPLQKGLAPLASVTMHSYLLNRLNIPPPPDFSSQLLEVDRQIMPNLTIQRIMQFTRLRYPLYSTDLATLLNFTRLAESADDPPRAATTLPHVGELYRRYIRAHIAQLPQERPFGQLDRDHRTTIGGECDLYRLISYVAETRQAERLLPIIVPELRPDMIPLLTRVANSLPISNRVRQLLVPPAAAAVLPAAAAAAALEDEDYPRPPVVSGPLFPEEENRYWLRLKSRADAFAVAANLDVAERLGINKALAARDSKRSQAGPADYTYEQNRLGPSPLIPLRNVTARERDSGLEICAMCLENMGSSTLIQPAGTQFGCVHTFCVDCSQAARLRKCPYCREPSVIDPLPRGGPRADFLFSHC
jgi:hypothetical protein